MIIEQAERHGDVSVVSLSKGNLSVKIERVGNVVCVTKTGIGNVRMMKIQAKMISSVLWD